MKKLILRYEISTILLTDYELRDCVVNIISKSNRFLYESIMMESNLHIKRSDFITIIDINLEYLRKLDYNLVQEEETNSLEKLLYILICEDKERRNELYSDDVLMEKVNEKIEELTEDFGSLYYDREEYRKEVITEVIQKETKQEVAKKMLKENLDIDLISKMTDLSKEEIENL